MGGAGDEADRQDRRRRRRPPRGVRLRRRGAKLAYVRTDTTGKTYLHVGAPGSRGSTTDISSFTHDPEKILFLGGHWFVISNDGARRAAVVGATGRIENQIGAFGDCVLSSVHGKTFVTVTDKGDTPAGHAYNIAAYRPNGAQMGSKLVTIGPDGTLAGSQGLQFVAFSGGYLQALVRKAGRYDAKADVRGGTQIAILDILSGKTGPAKALPSSPAFLHLADKEHGPERPQRDPDLRSVIGKRALCERATLPRLATVRLMLENTIWLCRAVNRKDVRAVDRVEVNRVDGRRLGPVRACVGRPGLGDRQVEHRARHRDIRRRADDRAG